MAACAALPRGQFCVTRIFRGFSHRSPRSLNYSRNHFQYSATRFQVPVVCSTFLHSAPTSRSARSAITVTEEADTLLQKVSVLVKGHDKAVLDSYEYFATMAAKELGIHISKVSEPDKDVERFTLLKSVHIFKKHRVQYETRTHYRDIELSHLTGSTAQVYLEYIQRNLPEGVAMEVTKIAMETIPDHVLEPMWKEEAPAHEK